MYGPSERFCSFRAQRSHIDCFALCCRDAAFRRLVVGLARRYLGLPALGPRGTVVACVGRAPGVLQGLGRLPSAVPVMSLCPAPGRGIPEILHGGFVLAGSAQRVMATVSQLQPATRASRWYSTLLLVVRAASLDGGTEVRPTPRQRRFPDAHYVGKLCLPHTSSEDIHWKCACCESEPVRTESPYSPFKFAKGFAHCKR